MPRQKKQVNFEAQMVITAAAAADKTPTFDILAYAGGTISQPWSDVPVVVDLAGMQIDDSLPLLYKHGAAGIGHITKADNNGWQLSISGSVSRDTEEAREFIASSRKGYPWKASIGASIVQLKQVREGTVEVNGQVFAAPVNVATKSRLTEVSTTERAASEGTLVAVTATQGDQETMKIVKLSNGTTIEVADDATPEVEAAAVAEAEKAIKVAAGNAGDKGDGKTIQASGSPLAPLDFTAERKARADEILRCNAIQAAAKDHPDIAAKAIADGWPVEKAELAVLRASRPSGINIHVPGQPEVTNQVLEAALCTTLGLDDVEKRFEAKVLEASHKVYRAGIGLQQLIVEAARRNGYTGTPFLRSDSDMRMAIRAAFSSDGLDSVFLNVMNMFLMTAFNAVEDTWREIAKIDPSVNDFRQYSTYANISDLLFADLGANGKIQHGVLKDIGYTNQLKTTAKMISITRADVINDAIGVLRDMTQKLGRGAALKLNVDFWTQFLDDAAFFSVANKNLLTGAGTALAHPGLKAAQTAFRKQLGPDGYPLGVEASILLTPPELEVTSAELMTSTLVNTGGAATDRQVPNRNIWTGKFKQATSVYLSNGALKNAAGTVLGSPTAWYLVAKPEDLPVITVGFLRGAVAPTIQQVQPDNDDLGIVMRGWFDYGINKQVSQAAIKNAGV